jgi:hypothetical protein
LNPKERKRIANPENIAGQGFKNRKFLPSESICPRDGTGGWAPNPRKDKDASTRIAADSNKLVWTKIIEVKFGKT